MSFRWGLVGSSAVFCAACVAWTGFRASAPHAAHPGIACEQPVYDFGSRRIGQTVSHAFTLRNNSDRDLEIVNVRPGCSCTKADFQQNTIKPRSSVALTLTVSLEDKRGPVEQHIVVESNDLQQKFLLLKIRGVVESDLHVTPSAINFGKVLRGELLTGSTIVEASVPSAFKLLKVSCDSPLCQVDQEAIEPGKSYRISIRTVGILPTGQWKTTIKLRTNNQTESRLTVPVVANVQAIQSSDIEN